MAYNEELAERMRACLAGSCGLREQKMFGGIAFLLNGNMCCGVRQDDLVLRVAPERYPEALAHPHARPMDITGRVMRGFVMVGPRGTERAEDLRQWVNLAADFAAGLPARPPGRKSPAPRT